MKRVPIFALVFICCGEFTPLVVIMLSSVVPWTCRIPRQIRADREKLEKRRSISFRNLTSEFIKQDAGEKTVENMGRMELLHICWSLGLTSSLWDWLGGQLPGLWTWELRRRVSNYVQYLRIDDELMKRAGRTLAMHDLEIELACVERGIDVMGRNEHSIEEELKAWLYCAEKVGIEHLLLTRPSVWPVTPPTQVKDSHGGERDPDMTDEMKAALKSEEEKVIPTTARLKAAGKNKQKSKPNKPKREY